MPYQRATLTSHQAPPLLATATPRVEKDYSGAFREVAETITADTQTVPRRLEIVYAAGFSLLFRAPVRRSRYEILGRNSSDSSISLS